MIAIKKRIRFVRRTGEQVEVVCYGAGRVVHCRTMCGKHKTMTRDKLCRHYRDTLAAREERKLARKEAINARNARMTQCPQCGGTKVAKAKTCRECRLKIGRAKTAQKRCECGRMMSYDSAICQKCRDEEGMKNKVGFQIPGVPGLTDEEARIVNNPKNRHEEELADAIIARVKRQVRIHHAPTCRGPSDVLSGVERDSYQSSLYGVPGSDRRRKGFY